MGTINFDFNFWTLSLLLLNFALALFVALSNRHKAAAEELQAVKSSLQNDIKSVQSDVKGIDRQVAEQGQRLATIESDVENGITKDDLSAVYNRINDTNKSIADQRESIGEMGGQLKEISKSMERLDQHLIELLRK